MVGLVDGILKFISSGLFSQFWEWMDNAIKFETGSVFIRWFGSSDALRSGGSAGLARDQNCFRTSAIRYRRKWSMLVFGFGSRQD